MARRCAALQGKLHSVRMRGVWRANPFVLIKRSAVTCPSHWASVSDLELEDTIRDEFFTRVLSYRIYPKGEAGALLTS